MKYVILTLFVIGLFSSTSQASIISFNGYVHDDSTDIVTGGGLEWLQWDVTDGMTINQALASNSGWRLATNTEMSTLFNSFTFGLLFDSDENTSQSLQTPWDLTEVSPYLDFVSLFGNTWTEATLDHASEPLFSSSAWFGTDLDNDTFYNYSFVNDDFLNSNGSSLMPHSAGMVADFNFNSADSASDRRGVALVKTITTVPEPSTVAIFSLGILGLIIRKQKILKLNR